LKHFVDAETPDRVDIVQTLRLLKRRRCQSQEFSKHASRLPAKSSVLQTISSSCVRVRYSHACLSLTTLEPHAPLRCLIDGDDKHAVR